MEDVSAIKVVAEKVSTDITGVKNDVSFTRTNIGDFWTQRISILAPVILIGILGLYLMRHYSYEKAKPRFIQKHDNSLRS